LEIGQIFIYRPVNLLPQQTLSIAGDWRETTPRRPVPEQKHIPARYQITENKRRDMDHVGMAPQSRLRTVNLQKKTPGGQVSFQDNRSRAAIQNNNPKTNRTTVWLRG
jgi:hypothetical protein